jgi:UDP-N-acetylglucosamine acyltransferase
MNASLPFRKDQMNSIHSSAVVAAEVELGEGNVIGPGVVLLGPLTVGDGNWFGAHTVIGAPAEIRGIDHGAAWDGQTVGTGITIGNGNVFREYVTIHQGHYDRTVVGDDCYLMNKVYIGHDGHLGDGVTMASSVTCGGHVHVGSGANLGMNTVVHQRRRIGPGAMVGMGSVVTRDLPPYAKAYGNPCRVRGANTVGMERSGLPVEAVQFVASAYDSGTVPDAGEPAELRTAWDWWRAGASA